MNSSNEEIIKKPTAKKCSICKLEGHNKKICPDNEDRIDSVVDMFSNFTISPIEPITLEDINVRVQEFNEYISSISNDKIVLLKIHEVIRWIFGDTSFLPSIEKKNKTRDTEAYKILENEWGRKIAKIKRPDLKLDGQWTNTFGEYIAEEIYILLGESVSRPTQKKCFRPDLEISTDIIEVKTGTFYTGGTAGEKILGCPFKYAEIPTLYSKPLKIVCVGGAEKKCRNEYGNLPGNQTSEEKKKFLEFYKSVKIEYIPATDLLKEIIKLNLKY